MAVPVRPLSYTAKTVMARYSSVEGASLLSAQLCWESELESAEKVHVCDPFLLARWNRARGKITDPPKR